MSTNQKGFTLVELVVVIVILGILAATALPKFINLTTQAHLAALDGLIGAVNSASSLCQAKYVATGNNAATTCTMTTGAPVDVVTVTGIPKSSSTGIVAALSANTGFTVGATCTAGATCHWDQNGTTAGTCEVVYTEATGTAARGVTTGC